jgi:hypothetical protein
VNHGATPGQIKKAFMRKAMWLHPDRRKNKGASLQRESTSSKEVVDEIILQKQWAEASAGEHSIISLLEYCTVH